MPQGFPERHISLIPLPVPGEVDSSGLCEEPRASGSLAARSLDEVGGPRLLLILLSFFSRCCAADHLIVEGSEILSERGPSSHPLPFHPDLWHFTIALLLLHGLHSES